MATANIGDLVNGYKKKEQKYFGLQTIAITNQNIIEHYGLTAVRGKASMPSNEIRFCGLLEMVANGEDFTAADGENLGAASKIEIHAPNGLQKNPASYTPTQLPKAAPGKSKLIERLVLLATAQSSSGSKQDRLKINFPKGASLTLPKIEKTVKLGGQIAVPGTVTAPSPPQQEKVTRSIFEILLTTNGYNPPANDVAGGFNPNINSAAGAKDAKTLDDFNLFCQGKTPKGYSGRPVDLSDYWPSIAKIAADGISTQKKGSTWTVNLNATNNPTIKEWYWSFFVQFKNIKNDPRLKNDTFLIFNHENGFMQFITDLIKAGPREIDTKSDKLEIQVGARQVDWPYFRQVTKKDSWNPADIWLIQNRPATQYRKFIKDIRNAKTVHKLNTIMIDAFKSRTIVGISLKKPSVTAGGKGNISYDLVNMTKHKHKTLPAVMYDDWPMELHWDNTTGMFVPTSNALFLKYEGVQVAKLDLRSSDTKVGNLATQFTGMQSAAALGRLPRPGLLRKLEEHGLTTTDLDVVEGKQTGGVKYKSGLGIPEWEEVQGSLPFTQEGVKNGAFPGAKMQKSGNIVADSPADIRDKKANWLKKFNYINSPSGRDIISGDISKLRPLLLNQIINARNRSSYKSGSKSQKTICIALQIVNFAYMLVKVYNKHHDKTLNKSKMESFSMFMRDLYYFAQKKGGYFGTQFGPFGKLH